MEGIVAKKKDGLYHIGKRTSDWIKIKVMQDEDLIVLGYQPDEDGKVKDLILGYYDKNGMLNVVAKYISAYPKQNKKSYQTLLKRTRSKDRGSINIKT